MGHKSNILIRSASQLRTTGEAIQASLGQGPPGSALLSIRHRSARLTLDALYQSLAWADFGLFLLAAQPDFQMRGADSAAEHLWFEAGFFLAKLGKERVFLLCEAELPLAPWVVADQLLLHRLPPRSAQKGYVEATHAFVAEISPLIQVLGPFESMDPKLAETLVEDQIHYTVKVLNTAGDGQITRQATIQSQLAAHEPVVRIKHRMALNHQISWEQLAIKAWDAETQEALHVEPMPHQAGNELVYFVYFPDPLEPGEAVTYQIQWNWPGVFGDPHNWLKMIRSTNGLSFRLILPESMPLKMVWARIEVDKLTGNTKRVRFPRQSMESQGEFIVYTYVLPEAIEDNGPLRVDWWYQ